VGTDTLHIDAAGAIFPAFSMDVPALDDVAITTDTGAWTAAAFDGSSPIPLAWTAGTGDDFTIWVTQDFVRSLTCITADDGTFEIPSAGLEALDFDSGTWFGAGFGRRNTVVVETADGEVTGIVQTAVEIYVGR
jgi:hypothetical protein